MFCWISNTPFPPRSWLKRYLHVDILSFIMRQLGVYSFLISCLAALLFVIYISFEHPPEALNPLNAFAMNEHYHHVKEDDQTFIFVNFSCRTLYIGQHSKTDWELILSSMILMVRNYICETLIYSKNHQHLNLELIKVC